MKSMASLVNATLHTLLPSANWVLELLDDHEQLEKATRIIVTLADITICKLSRAGNKAIYHTLAL